MSAAAIRRPGPGPIYSPGTDYGFWSLFGRKNKQPRRPNRPKAPKGGSKVIKHPKGGKK